MTRKLLILSGCLLLALNSCKSDMETTPASSVDHTTTQLNGTTIHKLLINGAYTYVNEVNGEYFYADDITITAEQFNQLKRMANPDISTVERSTIVSSFIKTWPNATVYYTLPSQGSLSTQAYNTFLTNINKAFDMISSKTNVKFIQRTNQTEYITFTYSTGNSSPLGWVKNRVNGIKIYNTTYPAIIAHEIMHSMGIMHEQCRPDRDQYIIVDTNRAQEGSRHNFNLYNDYAGHGEFDFGSVMMYKSTDFAIDPNLPVMTKLDGSTFGKQRDGLSAGDYAGINHLYGPVNSTSATNGTYTLTTSLAGDKNVDITGSSTADGTDVILYSATTGNNQKFIFRKSDHGYFTIKSILDSTKVLTVRNNGTANGTAVELRTNADTDSQKWLLFNLGNEGFGFAPKNAPSLRLEVKDGLTTNLIPIVIGSTDQTLQPYTKQRFKLTKVN
ncbi:RICIN domain-containing protein [Elizabethkingia anophelis]|uniref:Flavastacin n=1 Tax=Elizabethkingia anophelis R26 TaxID=1246994 RepID=A0ABM6MP24_9FLAO|nr:M12 family metallopeptidase [Elizabethkingia anophelis]ATC34793.1 flavastacin [Elizabethkingia anophelis R26]ATC38435.1 flavastacin [Elizabethkingia anophelis Ag1]ATC42115.1 flavastacin [Elizabethkingia anophelis]ATC45791.1 flavastacin [Elizabethkingia anophelis]ELR78562.1 peptidase M12A astacin [Elizabethkingia anophelis R26]